MHISSGTTTCRSKSAAATLTVVNDYEDYTSGNSHPNKGAAIDIRTSAFKAAGIKYFFPPYDPLNPPVSGLSLQIDYTTSDQDEAGNESYPNVYFKFV